MKRTFLETIKAVLWAFFGVRQNSAYEHDKKNSFNPIHIIIIALGLVACFVAILLTIISFIV